MPARGGSPSRFHSNVSPGPPWPGRVSQNVSRTTAAPVPAGTRASSTARAESRGDGWGTVQTNVCIGSSLHPHLPLFQFLEPLVTACSEIVQKDSCSPGALELEKSQLRHLCSTSTENLPGLAGLRWLHRLEEENKDALCNKFTSNGKATSRQVPSTHAAREGQSSPCAEAGTPAKGVNHPRPHPSFRRGLPREGRFS